MGASRVALLAGLQRGWRCTWPRPPKGASLSGVTTWGRKRKYCSRAGCCRPGPQRLVCGPITATVSCYLACGQRLNRGIHGPEATLHTCSGLVGLHRNAACVGPPATVSGAGLGRDGGDHGGLLGTIEAPMDERVAGKGETAVGGTVGRAKKAKCEAAEGGPGTVLPAQARWSR
jgi:hypothetical protein